MTQDEIYEMAHQAGVENEFNYDFRLSLEAFAKLVAAKEREALAKEKTLQALHSENERLGLYKEAYAPPEQEPVAWAVYCDEFIALPAFDTEQDALKEMQRRNKKWPHNKREVKALYDAPPQRTWVGLAAEDRLTAKYMQDAPDGIEAVIDYIEAKLKEKNFD